MMDSEALYIFAAANMFRSANRLTIKPPTIREPAPPKYVGQREAYLQGAWRGDGVEPRVTRQMLRKAERVLAKAERKGSVR